MKHKLPFTLPCFLILLFVSHSLPGWAQNVGIGTAAPAGKLHTVLNGGGDYVRVTREAGSGSGGEILSLNGSDGSASRGLYMGYDIGIADYYITTEGVARDLVIGANSGYAIHIEASNQRVGIFEDNPQDVLHVVGRGRFEQTNAGGNVNALLLRNTSGAFQSSVDIDFQTGNLMVGRVRAVESSSVDDESRLEWWTSEDGGVLTRQMYLTDQGALHVPNDYVRVGFGTGAQEGAIRYNTGVDDFEGYVTGTGWVSLTGGGGFWDRDAGNGYVYPQTLTDNVGIGTASPTDAQLQIVATIPAATTASGADVNTTTTNGTQNVEAISRLGRVGNSTVIGTQGVISLNETGSASPFSGVYGVYGSVNHPTGGTIDVVGADARIAGVGAVFGNDFSADVTERQGLAAVYGLMGMHNGGGGDIIGGGRVYAGLFQGNGRLLGLRGENSAFMEFLPDAQQQDYRTAVVGFYNTAANGGNNGGSTGSATSYFSIEANIPGLGDSDTEDDDIVMQFRTASGRVGIGEDNPDAKLHVVANSAPPTSTTVIHTITTVGGTDNSVLTIPPGTISATVDVELEGDVDGATENVRLRIDGVSVFYDNAATQSCPFQPVTAGIDISAQVVGNATVNLESDADPDVGFAPGGCVAFARARYTFTFVTQGTGLIVEGDAQKTGGGNWDVISDRRLKDNINDYNDGLDMILGINPKTFRYNGEGGIPKSNRDEIGIIAQELQQVAPYMVKPFTHTNAAGETQTYFKTNTSALDFAFVNAFKELNTRVLRLEKENAGLRSERLDLKATIEDQEARLQRLEKMMGERAER